MSISNSRKEQTPNAQNGVYEQYFSPTKAWFQLLWTTAT